MESALLFIVRTLFDLYLLTFALRLLLQWVRVDSWNPLVQFILRVTSPVVLPLRKVIPPVRRFDTATAVALLLLQVLGMAVLARLACGAFPGVPSLLLASVLSLVNLLLQIWFWSILVYAVLSWVGPGGRNPNTALLDALVRPVLEPVRRIVPPIGGLDLSALFAMIGIQAVMLLVPSGGRLLGMACAPGL